MKYLISFTRWCRGDRLIVVRGREWLCQEVGKLWFDDILIQCTLFSFIIHWSDETLIECTLFSFLKPWFNETCQRKWNIQTNVGWHNSPYSKTVYVYLHLSNKLFVCFSKLYKCLLPPCPDITVCKSHVFTRSLAI